MKAIYIWTVIDIMGIVLSLIIALCFLAAHIYASFEFYNVAVMKGWPQKKYLYISLLLWFAGYLIIVALPDRSSIKKAAVVSRDLPEL